jgi:hypothetical protein
MTQHWPSRWVLEHAHRWNASDRGLLPKPIPMNESTRTILALERQINDGQQLSTLKETP